VLLGGLAVNLPFDYPPERARVILAFDALAVFGLLALWPYHDVLGLRRLAAGLEGWLDARHPRPVISFDDEHVTGAGCEPRDVCFAWRDVVRIGYRTLEADPWFDDYFLEFHLADGARWAFPTSWPGALALCDRVAELPDARFGERGTLANVVTPDSIVVWPASEAGQTLDEQQRATA
jgi:hypothetical protein